MLLNFLVERQRDYVLLTISARFEHSPLIAGFHARNSAMDSLFEDAIPEHVSFCLTTYTEHWCRIHNVCDVGKLAGSYVRPLAAMRSFVATCCDCETLKYVSPCCIVYIDAHILVPVGLGEVGQSSGDNFITD
jgi:hypothetical protein